MAHAKTARLDRLFTCPACGQAWPLTRIRDHWADVEDDAHIDLEHGIEQASDDAYFDAEIAFVERHCEEASHQPVLPRLRRPHVRARKRHDVPQRHEAPAPLPGLRPQRPHD